MKISGPGSIIKFIEDTPALAEMVSDTRKSSEEIFEAIRKRVPERELLPMLRGMALIAIDTALDGEKRRIRKAVKAGKDIDTAFAWLLRSEIEWDDHIGTIEADGMRELLRKLNGILADWIMDNGQPIGMVSAGYLRQVASREVSLSDGHLRNAEFYERIAKDLPDDAIIGDHVSGIEAEAARLAVFGEHAAPLRRAA